MNSLDLLRLWVRAKCLSQKLCHKNSVSDDSEQVHANDNKVHRTSVPIATSARRIVSSPSSSTEKDPFSSAAVMEPIVMTSSWVSAFGFSMCKREKLQQQHFTVRNRLYHQGRQKRCNNNSLQQHSGQAQRDGLLAEHDELLQLRQHLNDKASVSKAILSHSSR